MCVACGRENRNEARFCDSCGAALAGDREPAREERKVITCLFCDLVGFTARAERLDPEDVRAMLAPYHSRVRTELERHGGTVEKFIGDAVMAVFGAPAAHEDDPERAIRAALAIRGSAREDGIELRIGIATGEALVNLGARSTEGEGMASGDVVNTAARLQAAAPVYGVLVGETTYRATRRTIAYRDVEPVAAKGKAEPVPAWEALEARARLGSEVLDYAAGELVGRERELDVLRSALDRARDEPSPQLVTVVGVPGIGKSRIVHELSRIADADPELITWRQGRCLAYGESVTFWALAEIVKAQAGILEAETEEEAARKLHTAVADAIADEKDAAWIEMRLRPLAGLETETELSGDGRGEAFAAWRRFFEALADQRTFVAVFEDLQWADDGLLDFIDELADWAGGVPLLLVCTARPELLSRRPSWGGGKLNATTVALSPLSDAETARLISEVLERVVLPADTQRSLLERAEGNPLYAEQFALLYAERGTAEELPLPESLQGIVAARLDGLPAAEKTLLQDASVVGKIFWTGCLPGDGHEPLLRELTRKGLFRRQLRSSVAGEDEYAFGHALVRDVAYSQIPRGERSRKHVRVAEWMESLGRPDDHAETVAHHWRSALEFARAAGQEVDELVERTRFALRDAGDRAFGLHAPAAAARLYEQALELWPRDDSERPYVLAGYGRAADDIEALADACDGLLARGDREAAADAEAALSELHWFRGEHEQSWEHILRATALLAKAPPSRAKAVVLHQLARRRMVADDHEEAARISGEALAMAAALNLPEIRADALYTSGVCRFALGDESGGLADLEQGVASAHELGSPVVCRGYTNLSALRMTGGDLAGAAEAAAEGVRAATRFGQRLHLRFLEEHLCEQAYWAGRWDFSREIADRRIAEAKAGARDYTLCGYFAYRALMRLAQDDLPGAVDDVHNGVGAARQTGDWQMLEQALAVATRVLCVAEKRDEATVLAEELTGRASPLSRCWLSEVCWVAGQLGRDEPVHAAMTRSLHPSWREAAVAVLEGDFARAADAYARVGSRPDEAYARMRTGDPTQVERSLAFFRSVDAIRYLREGETLLAAAS